MERSVDPQAIWETFMDHRLDAESSRTFRERGEYADLDGVSTPALILSAALAIHENPNGHLLLSEWRNRAEEFADAGPVAAEASIRIRLPPRGSLANAIEFGRQDRIVRALRNDLRRAGFPQIRRPKWDPEPIHRELEQKRRAQREDDSRAEWQRREREHVALEAERKERRRALARSKQRTDAEMRAYEALSDASERSQKARDDRAKPAIHDIPYRSQPWEEW